MVNLSNVTVQILYFSGITVSIFMLSEHPSPEVGDIKILLIYLRRIPGILKHLAYICPGKKNPITGLNMP